MHYYHTHTHTNIHALLPYTYSYKHSCIITMHILIQTFMHYYHAHTHTNIHALLPCTYSYKHSCIITIHILIQTNKDKSVCHRKNISTLTQGLYIAPYVVMVRNGAADIERQTHIVYGVFAPPPRPPTHTAYPLVGVIKFDKTIYLNISEARLIRSPASSVGRTSD